MGIVDFIRFFVNQCPAPSLTLLHVPVQCKPNRWAEELVGESASGMAPIGRNGWEAAIKGTSLTRLGSVTE